MTILVVKTPPSGFFSNFAEKMLQFQKHCVKMFIEKSYKLSNNEILKQNTKL